MVHVCITQYAMVLHLQLYYKSVIRIPKSIKRTVCLIFNPTSVLLGNPSLAAYHLLSSRAFHILCFWSNRLLPAERSNNLTLI